MNIVLCGPPFAGKTTLGTKIAKKLNLSFLDIDRELEKKFFNNYGQALTCRSIYEIYGESFFREIETKTIQSINVENYVIALGGGTLLSPTNQDIIKKLGVIIYLETSLKVLLDRLTKNSTPAYLKNANDPLNEFADVIMKRDAIYKRCANVHLKADQMEENDMIEKICECFYGQ